MSRIADCFVEYEVEMDFLETFIGLLWASLWRVVEVAEVEGESLIDLAEETMVVEREREREKSEGDYKFIHQTHKLRYKFKQEKSIFLFWLRNPDKISA